MDQITVLVVGGTGESWPGDTRTDVTGLLAGVTARLDERFTSRWVGYPSSYGPVPDRGGMSYAASVRTGSRSLREAMRSTIGPIMLIGYSQGCVVIRHALAEAAEVADRTRIVGVGLVADPHQPPGAVPGCDGFGVAGPGPQLPAGVPTLWIADPADMICNASPDSLVRDVADLTDTMSLADVLGWVRATCTRLRTNAFQNAARTSIRPEQWRRDLTRLRLLVLDILGYLPSILRVGGLSIRNRRGGRHTGYGTEPLGGRGELSGVAVLAQWMQVQATFAAASSIPTAA